MIAKVKFKDIKMKFALNRHSDYSSFYQVFVENSYPNLLRLLKDGDTVIDAGANAGVFTVMASYLVGGSGRIIAYLIPSVFMSFAIPSKIYSYE